MTKLCDFELCNSSNCFVAFVCFSFFIFSWRSTRDRRTIRQPNDRHISIEVGVDVTRPSNTELNVISTITIARSSDAFAMTDRRNGQMKAKEDEEKNTISLLAKHLFTLSFLHSGWWKCSPTITNTRIVVGDYPNCRRSWILVNDNNNNDVVVENWWSSIVVDSSSSHAP